ncbi:MAG: hypothetical protein ABGX04_12595 [Myxococcales bacterium]|nr:hypothetical protein [Myxococcales bacterium]
MKRIQLFEFEDFAWFPSWLRSCMTNLIVVLMRMLGVNKIIAHQVGEALKKTGQRTIVDLGSGSGGAMPVVLEELRAAAVQSDSKVDYALTMTDLYPNPSIAQHFVQLEVEGLSYSEKSVDATDIATAPLGLKTMINCFHHMRVEQAKKILSSAVACKQPLFIYELSNNKIPNIFWWLSTPIALPIIALTALFWTPMVRPMSWQQIVFTYLIPLIPIFYAWDGHASGIRTYSLDDIQEMLSEIEDDHYVWEVDSADDAAGKVLGIYLLGYPKPSEA